MQWPKNLRHENDATHRPSHVGAALLVFLVASSARLSHAHGYLKSPISRNYAARLNNKFYCEHCGQGNGGVPDVCGNPFQGSPGVNFTNPALWFDGFKATWVSGQQVSITIYLSTNHGGRMSMSLCPRDRFNLYPTCFKEAANQLRRISSDSKYDGKVYWYLKPSDVEITQVFRLPTDVSCTSGCVLQWYWVGYQNCYLPCESLSNDVDGECGKSVNGAGQCASITQTEQYNNCADVLILPANGTIIPPPPQTSPRPSPSLSTSPRPPFSPPPRPSPPSPPPPRPSPPSPPPPSPRPPSPPLRSSPPSPLPASPQPPSPPTAVCPLFEWKCSECSRLAVAVASRLGLDLELPCQQCVTATSDAWSCHNCFATATSKEMLLSCLSCAREGGGSGCSLVCAAKSSNSAAMGACVDCAKRSGNVWDCGTCFDRFGGDAGKRDSCLRCVGDKAPAWACAECSSRYGTTCEMEMCANCLRRGGDGWSCYTSAAYGVACGVTGSGRRLLQA